MLKMSIERLRDFKANKNENMHLFEQINWSKIDFYNNKCFPNSIVDWEIGEFVLSSYNLMM